MLVAFRIVIALLLLLCMAETTQAYWVNVSVKNHATQPVLNATVTLDSTTQTAILGYTNFTSIAAGTHSLIVKASTYQEASFAIDLTDNLILNVYLSNATAGGHLTTIQIMKGLIPAKAVLVKTFYNESLISSSYTGDDGRVAFWLESNKMYRINANSSCNYSLIPAFDRYTFQLCGNESTYKWSNQTGSTNLTNYTVNDTSGGNWSLQNITSSYLTSDIGLGPLAQGILSSIVLWCLMGFNVTSSGVIGIGGMVVMAFLGILSWVIVLFCGMTVIAMHLLEGKLG